MITSIEIENLRGIRAGRLNGLAPLTILTGPNGCGKSTVLDALLIATSPSPAEAVGQAIQRHPVVPSGASWLFSTSADNARLKINPGQQPGWRDRCLEKHEHCPDNLREHYEATKAALRERDALPPFS